MAATLVLDVIANTTKAVSGLRDLSGATDGATSATDKHSRSLGSMAKSAAKVAGAAALGGLVLMFKTGADEQKDFLAGQAQLAAGIKSTGNAANVSVKGLEGLASSIQDYSGQTDDSIVASEKMLLTFTNVKNEVGKGNDIFNQATKATADMAARMGGEASTYAVQLGKALNDPIKGLSSLSRIGVAFTAGQKKQITALTESGQTMKAQKIILKELNTEFGGSAKAAGDTLPGQLARAKRSFEDISQSLVTSLMPVITALVDILTKYVLPAFAALMGFITEHQAVFGILAGGILLVVGAVKAWNIAQAILNSTMLASPWFWVVLAIVALVAALVLAYKKVKIFRQIVDAVFHAVAAVVRWAVDFIKKHWALLLGILTGPIGLAVVLILKYKNQIVDAFKAIPGLIRSALSRLWAIITAPFLAAWHFIRDNVVGPLVRLWQAVPGAIGRALSGVWHTITSPFLSAWHFIRDKVIGPLKSAFRVAFDWAKSIWNGFADAWNAIEITLPKVHIPGTSVDIGGGTIGLPDLPHLAAGGYVRRATLAVVGEGRGGEIVAPEPVLRSIIRSELAAGAGVTINVNGALDPDAVARQISGILRKRAQRVGGPTQRGQVFR
jgi:hypothetical protein